ncbi:YtxH domain-containing protein [Ktedonobacter robiniae]|uniref:DUF1640 domain-containing protein n=1 Tax=Ktedonobacter robiniae TaxID=2778365 RepID=A0ABQ3URV6_9CHLR|nr:YtxH domain-containing protein [Ktedonobacter robiniae]GHO55534.1 hypothetical protein KSB_40090 [Ktedonobacter robiniae]
MSPQINPDYQEIRQIVVDAIEPLKEQLDRIYESLKDDYARKDVVEPQIEHLREEVKNLKEQVVSTPQKLLMYVGSIAALIWTLYNILQTFK